MRDGLDFLALNRGILWALVLWRVLVSWGMSVVFVCVGFAFYLQGRMQLEGWGIGLGLKALARRLAVVVVLGWLGLGLRGEAVWAMSEEERQAYGARVQEVMEAPEVSPYGWQKIRDGADARKGGRFDLDGEDFAVMLRGGLVLGALGVAVWMGGLVWRRWRERRRFGDGALGVGVPVGAMMPELSGVWGLYEQGAYLAVVGGLYQRLVLGAKVHGLPEFARGEAEFAYLSRVRGEVDGRCWRCVQEVLGLWVLAVYAGRSLRGEAVLAVLQEYEALWGRI